MLELWSAAQVRRGLSMLARLHGRMGGCQIHYPWVSTTTSIRVIADVMFCQWFWDELFGAGRRPLRSVVELQCPSHGWDSHDEFVARADCFDEACPRSVKFTTYQLLDARSCHRHGARWRSIARGRDGTAHRSSPRGRGTRRCRDLFGSAADVAWSRSPLRTICPPPADRCRSAA